MKREIIISSVSQYLDTLKKFELEGLLSRGENTKYSEILASGFRLSSNLDYKLRINEFSRTVTQNLTEIQRHHFIAFSQHHGLPSNLIDFTKSPLVSLFFSCYSTSIPEKENGFIYFIDDIIDITSHIAKNNFFDLGDLFYYAEDGNMAGYRHYLPKKILLKYLRDNLKHLEDLGVTNERIDAIENNDDSLLLDIAKKMDYWRFDCSKYLRENWDALQKRFADLYSMTYLILLHEAVPEQTHFSLPCHFVYNPPEVTNRIGLQHSIFVYQFGRISKVFRPVKVLVQKISPCFTIEVEGASKMSILQDLDYLGINIKTVFGDYDHIAKYIANKDYERSNLVKAYKRD